VADTLACKNRHEQEVVRGNLAQEQILLQSQRAAAGFLRNAIFYGLAGGLFAAFGIIQVRFLGLQAVFLILIGLFLLWAAASNFSESRRYL
jgi:hypothetical protein